MSPATSAHSERLRRSHASPWTLSSSRAPSTAPSNISADSATRPCTQSDVPSMMADQREEVALAGRASDRERTLGVTAGLDEAVEVHLGGRQVDERVEAAGQLLVGQLVDQRRRLVSPCLRFDGTVACERRRHGAHASRRGDQHRGRRARSPPRSLARTMGPCPRSRPGRGSRPRARSSARLPPVKRDPRARRPPARDARAPLCGGRADARRRHIRR